MNQARIGWPGILFCIFLVLKLTDTIDWSWWWIFAPLWIPFGVFIVVALTVVALAALAGSPQERRQKRLRKAARQAQNRKGRI